MQAAGITLLRGDVRLVAQAIDISRRTHVRIRQNLFWAFVYASRADEHGEASGQSTVSTKMIRHYESLGLLPTVRRSESGYRQDNETTVHTLRFIRRARDLGFGLGEIEPLLGSWRNRRRASADVRRIAPGHVADLQQRIDELLTMQRSLQHLGDGCQRDARPGPAARSSTTWPGGSR